MSTLHADCAKMSPQALETCLWKSNWAKVGKNTETDRSGSSYCRTGADSLSASDCQRGVEKSGKKQEIRQMRSLCRGDRCGGGEPGELA